MGERSSWEAIEDLGFEASVEERCDGLASQ